jgi:hypothetical protein
MPDGCAVKPVPLRPRSRWKRRLVLLAVVAGTAVCFHGRILRSLAEILVVEDPPAAAQAVLMISGESRFDEAVKLHADGTKAVFILRSHPGRLERMGILPSAEQLARRALLARGVPEDDLFSLSAEPIANSRVGAVLCDRLREHAKWHIAVLCDRFSTRKWRLLLRRSADPQLAARIHLIALPEHGFDETNWWRSKPGVRAILNGYLRLGFTWWHDGPLPAGRECTQADFDSVAARRANP